MKNKIIHAMHEDVNHHKLYDLRMYFLLKRFNYSSEMWLFHLFYCSFIIGKKDFINTAKICEYIIQLNSGPPPRNYFSIKDFLVDMCISYHSQC